MFLGSVVALIVASFLSLFCEISIVSGGIILLAFLFLATFFQEQFWKFDKGSTLFPHSSIPQNIQTATPTQKMLDTAEMASKTTLSRGFEIAPRLESPPQAQIPEKELNREPQKNSTKELDQIIKPQIEDTIREENIDYPEPKKVETPEIGKSDSLTPLPEKTGIEPQPHLEEKAPQEKELGSGVVPQRGAEDAKIDEIKQPGLQKGEKSEKIEEIGQPELQKDAAEGKGSSKDTKVNGSPINPENLRVGAKIVFLLVTLLLLSLGKISSVEGFFFLASTICFTDLIFYFLGRSKENEQKVKIDFSRDGTIKEAGQLQLAGIEDASGKVIGDSGKNDRSVSGRASPAPTKDLDRTSEIENSGSTMASEGTKEVPQKKPGRPSAEEEEKIAIIKIQEKLGLFGDKVLLDPSDLRLVKECGETLQNPIQEIYSPLFSLSPGEKLFFTFPARLLKDIPKKGKRVFFPIENPIDGFSGLVSELDNYEPIAEGTIGVTNNRLIFANSDLALSIRYFSVSSIDLFSVAVRIHSAEAQPVLTIEVDNPPLLVLEANQVYLEQLGSRNN